MKNRFGRRYISQKEFLDYAKDLDLFTDHPPKRLLEFLEKHGILNPVARIRFPPEIVRRWHKDRYSSAAVPDPIEGKTPRLAAANDLHNDIFNNLWGHAHVYGERMHPLDEMSAAHAPFVQTTFDPSTFIPWEQFRTVIESSGGKDIGDGGTSARTCYHYWQIFILAAFLRSGVTILYDPNDDNLFYQLHELNISDSSRDKLYVTLNFEAQHELSNIDERARLFDAVAWFKAYCQNALQKHRLAVDRDTRRLPHGLSREYRKRCRTIADETLQRFALGPDDILSFIKFQCELWCTAKVRSPAKLADEYAHNIDATIRLYREVTKASGNEITQRVGRVGGYFKPILKVIFPSWLDDQRDLAERSLKNWILPSLASLPTPFSASERDIGDFCDWLEQQGLFQLYWHFKRLMDLGFDDGPIARSATAGEVVSYANTVELLANAIIEDQGNSPRGSTLAPKIQSILRPHAPQLIKLLRSFGRLTRTNNSTLKRRLAQIDRIKRGGDYARVLRMLLKLIVIRNEGSHLGLTGFDRPAIFALLEALVHASFVIWKVR